MNWPLQEMSVNDIYLDTKNIRLPNPNTSQEALLLDLFSNEDAYELVKSYNQNKVFQDEFPIVIKEKGKFIVVEGNRRLAALKAINNPERVPSFKEKIKALKAKKIPKIPVLIAPNREATMQLIAIKHTTNARKTWKPLRQAYFYKSQLDNGKTIDELKTLYPDVDLKKFIKFLEMHHLAKTINYDTDEISLKVHDERKFEITNLERMYNDPNVQEYLGIAFDNNGFVKIDPPKDQFQKAYSRFVQDVATGTIDSRQYNKAEERKEYINNLPAELKPVIKSKTGKPAAAFKPVTVDKDALAKSIRSNPTPKGVIPPYVVYKLESSALKEVYNELRKLSVKDFPNAAHDLLRSFLESCLAFHLKNSGEFGNVPKKGQYNPGLREMLTFISSDKCTSIADDNVKQVALHLISLYAHPYSLVRYNMINHNENWISEEKEVRAAWSKLEPIMKIILNPPSKNNE